MLSKVPRAKKVICCVYFICFTTTLTTPFEWTLEKNTDPVTNTSKFQIASSRLGKEETYRTIYYWFTSIAFVNIPIYSYMSLLYIITLIVVYISIGIATAYTAYYLQLLPDAIIPTKSTIR